MLDLIEIRFTAVLTLASLHINSHVRAVYFFTPLNPTASSFAASPSGVAYSN